MQRRFSAATLDRLHDLEIEIALEAIGQWSRPTLTFRRRRAPSEQRAIGPPCEAAYMYKVRSNVQCTYDKGSHLLCRQDRARTGRNSWPYDPQGGSARGDVAYGDVQSLRRQGRAAERADGRRSSCRPPGRAAIPKISPPAVRPSLQ